MHVFVSVRACVFVGIRASVFVCVRAFVFVDICVVQELGIVDASY